MRFDCAAVSSKTVLLPWGKNMSDIEGGAKITFVASGADVAKLQSELRMHAQHFAAGTCGIKS